MLFGICLRYSDSRETAEDILQDTFVKIYSSISDYDYKIVHSDSEMVMGVMNQGCTPKDDTDLVEELKSLAARASATGVPVYFEMANGRDDWDYFNEVADELAEAACSASDAMEDKGYVASQATWPAGEAN